MTTGLRRRLIGSLKLGIEVPHYSLLCKRQKGLKVVLPKKSLVEGERLHWVVDTTGLKLYGEGEWKVRQHGGQKCWLWRELHLGVNAKTQVIESFALTDLGVQDWEGLPALLSPLAGAVETVTGDGSYDKYPCYELGYPQGFTVLAPPQKNARTAAV